MPRPPSAALVCPRCGYDLRSEPERWTDACPVEGRCSECGLAFGWVDVFDPLRTPPRWCVEYARIRGFPLACLRTLLGSALPWRFWSRLRMEMPVRDLRIAAYILTLSIVLPWMILSGTQACRAGSLWLQIKPVTLEDASGAPLAAGFVRVVGHALVWPLSKDSVGTVGVPVTTGFTQTAVFASPWVMLRQQTRVYLLTSFVLPPTTVDEWLEWFFGRSSDFTARLVSVVACGFRTGDPHSPVVQVSWFGPIQAVGCVVSFALLPQSRRKARVRWRHLWRIAGYSMVVLVLPTLVPVALAVWNGTGMWSWGGHDWRGLVLVAAPTTFLLLWWAAATQVHLRMPHAWGVGLAAVSLGTLGAIFGCF